MRSRTAAPLARRRHRRLTALAVVTALTVSGACGGSDDGAEPGAGADADDPDVALTLTSDAFFDGSPIPVEHSCDGDGLSPPLTWSGLPADATTMTLTVIDPDAASGEFVHWSVTGIPSRVAGVGAGAAPPGIEEANSAEGVGWVPPCPPPGDGPHRYVFTLTALDDDGDAVARGSMFGTYERSED